MSITTLSGMLAVLFYLAGTFSQTRSITSNTTSRDRSTPRNRRTLYLGLVAVAAHIISALGVIRAADGYHFGTVPISTLILASISLLLLISGLRKPIGNLILAIFPMAVLVIILSLTVRSDYPPTQMSAGIASHVLLSILAYSFFTIAALQSGLLAFQNHQLRHHHVVSVIRRFPPLQDMERLLFELLWAGQILLSLAIVAGFLFLDDIWAQGIPHKTFFSLLAWVVFSVLLWGRHRLGWRGTTAIRGTLTGFVFLIVGFYGSKLVLEYVL